MPAGNGMWYFLDPPLSSSSPPPASPTASRSPGSAAIPGVPPPRGRGTPGQAAAIPPGAAHVRNGRAEAGRAQRGAGGGQPPSPPRGCVGGPGRSAQSYAGPVASRGKKPSGPRCADDAPQPNFQVLCQLLPHRLSPAAHTRAHLPPTSPPQLLELSRKRFW